LRETNGGTIPKRSQCGKGNKPQFVEGQRQGTVERGNWETFQKKNGGKLESRGGQETGSSQGRI